DTRYEVSIFSSENPDDKDWGEGQTLRAVDTFETDITGRATKTFAIPGHILEFFSAVVSPQVLYVIDTSYFGKDYEFGIHTGSTGEFSEVAFPNAPWKIVGTVSGDGAAPGQVVYLDTIPNGQFDGLPGFASFEPYVRTDANG